MAGALFVLTSPIPGRASTEPLATAATEASFASEAEKGAEGNLKYSFTTGFPLVAGAVASVAGLYRSLNGSLAPGPVAFLQRTGLQQSPLQSFRAGPTIQLGMAAAAFADRPVGTAGLAFAPSLSRMTSAVKARNTVFVTAMDQQGLHWHNVLRAGNWYGWRSMRGVGSFDNPTTLGDIKLLSFDEVGGGLGAYSIGQLPLNQGFGTVVYESLRLDLDPRATFTDWQPVFASNTPLRQIVPIVIERGFADLFAVTTLGNVRWFRRPAGTLVWTEQALNSRGILPVTGQIALVRTAGEGVVLYSVHSTGVMYSALYSGGTWFPWRPVLQDAVAINDVHGFAVAKIAPQTTMIAAIRTGQVLIQLRNSQINDVRSITLADEVDVVSVNIVPFASINAARVILTHEGGRISVRTVVNGTPFNPFRVRPSYDLGFASEQSDVVVSPWQNDVSLVLAARGDGVGVFRVLDHTYPAP